MWSAIGVVLLVDGKNALNYFPYFWFANDVALAAAFAGVVMHLFAAEPSRGPKVDEWTGWDPTPDLDLPLEELLVRLASAAERQRGPPR